jgi:hypothetical protein
MEKEENKISLPASHVSFIPPKNPILPLIKNSVRRNQNFSSSNFRKISVFRNKSLISRQKKYDFKPVFIVILSNSTKFIFYDLTQS